MTRPFRRASQANRSDGRGQIAAVVGFVVLTLLFTLRGCPSEELEANATRRLEAATGAEAHFEKVELAFDWGTPKLRLRRGRLVWPDGERLDVSYARLKPRSSWGWLIGRPSFYLKLNSELGSFRGWVSPHRNTASGTVDALSLESLPYERLALGNLRLRGIGELAFSGGQGETLWNGTVLFRAVNGTLTLPNAPLPIPFTLLNGRIELGDKDIAMLEEFVVEGPMGRVTVLGRIARGVPDPGLNLDLELDLKDPTLLQLLAESGLRIRPGTRQVHIGGTASQPVARARRASRR